MTEVVDQTFITALPDDKHSKSFVLSEDADELTLNADSSNDFDYKSVTNEEFDEVVNDRPTPEVPAPTTTVIQLTSSDAPLDQASANVNVYSQSVYDYAGVIYGRPEDPHQNKLAQDVQTILGSSDPPPGFGFLHPKVYYLTQKQPIPMEPLQVWRGYNGNVYFVPIKVKQLDSNRNISPTQPRQRPTVRTAPVATRRPQRSQTLSSSQRSRKSLTFKSSSSRERTSTHRTLSGDRGCARTISSENELTNNTRTTFSDEEDDDDDDNREPDQSERKTMWRSVITCMPAPKKPISKRSQHALDDIRAMKQQHIAQDPFGFNRPVLPNIRVVPKTKFLYRGLAYKEVQKIPGVVDDNDENSVVSLKRPLVDYDRAQTYARHEVQATRTKQKRRAPPAAPQPDDEQMTRSQTVLDLRETRKRIVKGTTATHYPASKRPGRAERSTLASSEVLVPIRGISNLPNVPASSSALCMSSRHQNHKTGYVSPMVSQNFEIPSVETNLSAPVVFNPEPRPLSANSSTVISHVEPLPPPVPKPSQAQPRPLTGKSTTTTTTEQRPSTSKSSRSNNAGSQPNAGETTLLAKYVLRPRSTHHQPPTENLNVAQRP